VLMAKKQAPAGTKVESIRHTLTPWTRSDLLDGCRVNSSEKNGVDRL
jgi:hypothetical protein